MTEEYLAHSVKEGCPAQSYRDHVSAVTERAVQYATEAGRYCALGSAQLELVARQSGQLHDLGKLDDENQAVLRQFFFFNFPKEIFRNPSMYVHI